MSSVARNRNKSNNKKSILKFQQEKQSKQTAEAQNVSMQMNGIDGLLSIADQQMIEIIKSKEFQKVRSVYSTKFDNFNSKVHAKDYDQSIDLLNKANQLIDKQDYRQALKLLNEAVLHANHQIDATLNSQAAQQSQLSLVLMQRALCLQRLDYLEECIADVDALLAIGGLGSRTRERLRKCRSVCRNRLTDTLNNIREEQPDNSLLNQKEQFKVSSELFGAIDSIKIGIIPGVGRGLFAKEDLPAGHLILDQLPYTSVLSPQLFTRHCSHCLKKLNKSGVFISCRHCIQVRYCSITCERASWTEGHEIECRHLELLQFSADFHLQPRLAFKILLKSGCWKVDHQSSSENSNAKENQNNQTEQMEETNELNQVEATDQSKKSKRRRRKGNCKSKTTSIEGELFDEPDCETVEWFALSDYKTISSLKTHSDQCPDFAPSVCMLLVYLDKRMGSFQNEHLQRVAVLLLRNLQRVHCNGKYVFERQLRSEVGPNIDRLPVKLDTGVSEPMCLNEQRLGMAIYSTYSLLNHNCEPNVLSLQVEGNRLLLKTLRPIAANEQLTISYGTSARWHSYPQRFLFLRRFYFFICDCAPCVKQQDAPAACFRCSDCGGGAVRPLLLDEKEQPAPGRCSRCPHLMRTDELQRIAKFVQASESLLSDWRKLLSEKRTEVVDELIANLTKLKQEAESHLHAEHQLHWRILQLRSLCYRMKNQWDLSFADADQVLQRLDTWCGEAYAPHLNARLQFLDRCLFVLKERPQDDRLRLRFLHTLKNVKQWMDTNLMPNTDEYMYLLSLLSLCFTGYSQLGVRSSSSTKVSESKSNELDSNQSLDLKNNENKQEEKVVVEIKEEEQQDETDESNLPSLDVVADKNEQIFFNESIESNLKQNHF